MSAKAGARDGLDRRAAHVARQDDPQSSTCAAQDGNDDEPQHARQRTCPLKVVREAEQDRGVQAGCKEVGAYVWCREGRVGWRAVREALEPALGALRRGERVQIRVWSSVSSPSGLAGTVASRDCQRRTIVVRRRLGVVFVVALIPGSTARAADFPTGANADPLTYARLICAPPITLYALVVVV